MSTARKDLLAILIIAVLTLVTYYNAFGGEFQYDDDRLIRFNFTLRDLSLWKNIFLFEPFRPLTLYTYALNYSLSAKNPTSYHVFDFLLHLSATTLFFFFLRRMTSNVLLCFFSAALFAVHPLNTESVSYIASRFILLCAVFYWCALHLFDSHVRNPHWYKPLLFFLFFLASATSKEEAVLIPVAVLFYNFAVFGWKSVRKHRLFHAVTLLFIGVAGFYRVYHLSSSQAVLPHDPAVYASTEIFVWLKYLQLAILPVSLNVDHYVQALHPSHWKFLVSAAGVIFIFLGLWKARANHPWIFLWGTWFFLNLLASSFIPLNDFMAEHRTYLSMFGFCAVVAYSIQLARSRSKLIPVALCLLLSFYVAATIKRNQVWQKRITLWADTSAKSPQKYRPHINLAFTLYQLRQYENALHEYLIARQLNPSIPLVHSGLGLTLLELNRFDEAESSFQTALQIDPHFIDAKTGLGILSYEKGQYKEAIAYFVQTYPYRREAPELIVMMCDSYLKLGQVEEAARILEEASSWNSRFAGPLRMVRSSQIDAASRELQRIGPLNTH